MARACVLGRALVSMQALPSPTADAASRTVIDRSGLVVPGHDSSPATERTGEERIVVANAMGATCSPACGNPLHDQLPSGFRPVEYTGVQLAAAQEFPLDLTLQAAGVTEAVTVKGHATAMDLSSARIGVNVTEREVRTCR